MYDSKYAEKPSLVEIKEKLMNDLFQQVKGLSSVDKISNLGRNQPVTGFTAVFFVCPWATGDGYNARKGKIAVKYRSGISPQNVNRFERVKYFLKEARTTDLNIAKVIVWIATTDSIFLTDQAARLPQLANAVKSQVEPAWKIVSAEKEISTREILRWQSFREKQPWNRAKNPRRRIPGRIVSAETERLEELLNHATKAQKQDWVNRIFAGYWWDGITLKKRYGNRMLLLGVESPGVSVFQNGPFSKANRFPVIQLNKVPE